MPRINSASVDHAPEASRTTLNQLGGHGKVKNVFLAMSESATALNGFLAFSKTMNRGTLSAKSREGIAIMMAQQNHCDYCMTAHQFMARQLGMSDEDIELALKGKGGGDARSAAAIRLAAQILRTGGFVSDTDLEKARAAGLTNGDIVEIVGLIAVNTFTNLINHVNDTEIDFPNPIKVRELAGASS